MTGVRECSQQRGNLKDDGYIIIILCFIWNKETALEGLLLHFINILVVICFNYSHSNIFKFLDVIIDNDNDNDDELSGL
ncbi:MULTISPECIES: hypothetical protein [Photorhabdus]|uniref:hypothetical protein n=1 Tax=Photorhabdus TaxID=29487 RepID=UPI0003044A7E|nr:MULTISPECIES: hypothetical protein [Photorhabdus]NDK94004.1 hypothetical protein [Photorhabdus laumondii subsp. laumondii]NDL49155.1 hypothetical protein [Photorhabdus laumondii subsp. laumondii]